MTEARHGRTKITKLRRDVDALRTAIRTWADHEEIEAAWDRCERWVDRIFTTEND